MQGPLPSAAAERVPRVDALFLSPVGRTPPLLSASVPVSCSLAPCSGSWSWGQVRVCGVRAPASQPQSPPLPAGGHTGRAPVVGPTGP